MIKKRLLKQISFLFLLTPFLLLTGCLPGGDEGNKSDSVTLTFAFELPNDHPWGKGAEEFKEIVENETDEEVKIDIQGGGSMGDSGSEIQEGSSVGSIDIGISSTPLSEINPYAEIFSLPYIFETREEAWDVLDGTIGEEVGERLEENDLKHLAWWEDGFRQVTNNVRAIESPEDFDKLKIRVPESDVRIDTFKELGASPLSMSFSEVFTGMEQGSIDGQENPLSVVESSSYYDVQEYLTITDHVYTPASLFINMDKWESLTDEQQEIVLKAAEEGRDVNRELNAEKDDELVDSLKEEGMEVNTIEDPEPFQEKTKPVWDELADELGEEAEDIIDKIQDSK
ncbi:MAG TPA: DctP family TRAP transporter solute-binding subunit [Pseudogracilibacillus sp.]|nr:DctP family TRAP transporter solute-binding subunit [Pseudogracilibacillus sp.]